MSPPRRRFRPLRFVLAALAAAALGGWLAVHLLLAWISNHPAVLAAGVVVAGGVSYLTGQSSDTGGRARTRPDTLPTGVRDMSPRQFEEYVAGLCRRDGCRQVEVVGGAGDMAADILATTPTGRRMLVQCKRYAPGNLVRSPEVQRVGGTYAVVHGAQLAVVVTTGSYTTDATEYAAVAGIRLVDGTELAAWATGKVLPPWGGERMMGT